MPDLTSEKQIYMALLFLVPGLVALYFRSQFLTGRQPSQADSLLSYLAISLVYYSVALPTITWLTSLQSLSGWQMLWWFVVILLGPAILGTLLGVSAQTEFIRRIAIRLGFSTVHPMPTAWDWKFSKAQEQWVLVTLKDGTFFAGYCGPSSFMSSDPAERDIYIQKIYRLETDGSWTDRGDKGVLITGGEIRTIEFWPVDRGDL